MLQPSNRAIRFVRALLTGGEGRRQGEVFALSAAGRMATLEAGDVLGLQSEGVLTGDAVACSAADSAKNWLRRAMAEADGFAAQHRILARGPEGRLLNLAESPLARLATPGPDAQAPFLAAHQVEAGERVRKLAERALLQPRVTMAYDPTHTAGGKGGGSAAEIGEMAAEARRALAEIPRLLPRDCAGVVIDVCGLLKGLQVVESERGWPRRSAKLVLRIGLDQLARHYGLDAAAVGRETRHDRSWIGEGAKPTVFE